MSDESIPTRNAEGHWNGFCASCGVPMSFSEDKQKWVHVKKLRDGLRECAKARLSQEGEEFFRGSRRSPAVYGKATPLVAEKDLAKKAIDRTFAALDERDAENRKLKEALKVKQEDYDDLDQQLHDAVDRAEGAEKLLKAWVDADYEQSLQALREKSMAHLQKYVFQSPADEIAGESEEGEKRTARQFK